MGLLVANGKFMDYGTLLLWHKFLHINFYNGKAWVIKKGDEEKIEHFGSKKFFSRLFVFWDLTQVGK
jgi:hypothetical protein